MSIEDINKAVTEIKTNFEEMKKDLKQQHEQMATKGHVDALLKEKMERINDAITKAEDAQAAAEKAQAMAKTHRMAADVLEKGVEINGKLVKTNEDVKKAFAKFLRKGEKDLDAKEIGLLETHTKSMSSGSDPAGGYAVIPEMDAMITRILLETSPIRQVAEVKQISTDQMERLQRVDQAASGWADRDGAPSETTAPTFKKMSVKAYKQYAEPAISQDLIDDAYIDVEKELMLAVSQSFELLENTAFVSGNGIGQPKGFLSYPSSGSWATPNSPPWGNIQQVNSGAASTLTYGGIIDLVYSLKDGYHPRAVFLANRLTVAEMRKLVDGIGQALWQPGFGSEPATFMGYSIKRAADMPKVQASALALAFGDFSQGYLIVDRLGMRILRDPYTSKPFILYYTTKRVGGGVNNFEAIKLQKISA